MRSRHQFFRSSGSGHRVGSAARNTAATCSPQSLSGYFWLQHSGIGGTSVGVNNNTDFLRSVTEGIITARSQPIHRGRRQQLWSVDMRIDDGTLVARSQVRLQNIAMPESV
ncbi:PaaI family thioesterase [Gordonia sp. N1V]|uniref:PaaI family thioesterase n=1 Tax=Gordonia sp. N1V TaxID=3034163 RepID=UPI0031FE4A40